MIAPDLWTLDQGVQGSMNRSRWFLLGKQVLKNQIDIFSHIFANDKSTSLDFKAPSLPLPDASNEKFLLFLAVPV